MKRTKRSIERVRLRDRGTDTVELVLDACSRSSRSSRRSALLNCELWCVAVAPDTGIVTEYYKRQINTVTNPNSTSLLVTLRPCM
jgi:hypothetical protein